MNSPALQTQIDLAMKILTLTRRVLLSLLLLGGVLLFFVLEKLVLWRHCHAEDCEVHDGHDHQHEAQHAAHGHEAAAGGRLVILGDAFHNFVDGVLIASAFIESDALGLVAATAVIVHQIPQAVGDYLVLVHSGYRRARALASAARP